MTKTKLLTREQILKADDLPVEIVPVPEWGGDVAVKGLSEGGVHDLLSDAKDEEGEPVAEQMNLLAVVYGIIDANGDPVFVVGDVPALREKSAAALARVRRVFMRLCGMDPDAAEEARKN